jgi:hypothetical protein
MRRKILFITLVLAFTIVHTQESAARNGLAIVIDKVSFDKAHRELNEYISALEDKQNFKVYTIVDHWGIPDSIRHQLIQLHHLKKNSIVGAVFIGDIPIPMIRDAQHLTSAFKMNQSAQRKESSVPSDRYYDDFKLVFDSEGSDAGTQLFYYSLSDQSAQYLHPDIFSGRIRPTDAGGVSKYEKLKSYLHKASEAKRHPEKLKTLFVFTGNGSISDSKVAHIDEFRGLSEHFPQLYAVNGAFSYMDYSDEPVIKFKLMNELMRSDLDLALLHHHGDWDTQYLSTYPKPSTSQEARSYMLYLYRERIRTAKRFGHNIDSIKSVIIKKDNIPAEWLADAQTQQREHEDSLIVDKQNLTLKDFSLYKFQPNCRLVIFDACYNGSFHQDDCIADEYIFQQGRTLVGIGGSVNVLQDKWPDQFIGLLGHGMMVGFLNQYTCYLESHIIGDPTFSFMPEEAIDVNGLMVGNQTKKWLSLFKHTQNADLKAMAMEQLKASPFLTSERLLSLLEHAPNGTVRLEAFCLLKERGGRDLIKAINVASADNYEMVQRFAVNAMAESGSPETIPSLARLLTGTNTSQRVAFNALQSVQFFPKKQLIDAVQHDLDSMSEHLCNYKEYSTNLILKINEYAGRWDQDIEKLCLGKMDSIHALRQAEYLRIYCPPYLIPGVVGYAEKCQNTKIKKALLEALGWHKLAYTSSTIKEMTQKICNDTSLNPEIRREALKTYKRVTPYLQK